MGGLAHHLHGGARGLSDRTDLAPKQRGDHASRSGSRPGSCCRAGVAGDGARSSSDGHSAFKRCPPVRVCTVRQRGVYCAELRARGTVWRRGADDFTVHDCGGRGGTLVYYPARGAHHLGRIHPTCHRN